MAEVVDHIIPHKGDINLFWDTKNWQALCKWHHDSVKQREEKGKEVRAIGLDGMPEGW
jgi:5-methylcytosine-specific restriction enzyme A